MLALRLLVTYAYLPAMGSISIQQAAVPSSPTCALIVFRPPSLATTKDETALVLWALWRHFDPLLILDDWDERDEDKQVEELFD